MQMKPTLLLIDGLGTPKWYNSGNKNLSQESFEKSKMASKIATIVWKLAYFDDFWWIYDTNQNEESIFKFFYVANATQE